MDARTKADWDAARPRISEVVPAACYAPFVSMFFTTTGDVVVCCESQSFSLGNVTKQSLDAIWHGKQYRRLRQALTAYELPASCSFCAWQMASGDLHGVTAKHFDHYEVEEMDPPWPQVMEFSLSNTCNLECIMCNGASSSLIRSRREKLPPLPRVYGNDFFRDLRPFLPHLKTAKFLGGEPFLIPEVHRIWDFMIEDKLTTDCVVTTNGTRYDAKVERVLERLPMSIIFSMDGATKATLERIRVNAKFDALVDHAKRFIHYTRERGTKFRFIYSLMQQNWHELGDFLLFAEALGVEVNLSPVVHPAECSLYALPGEELHTIVKQLEARRASVARQLQLNRETWTNAIDTIAANVFANKGELGVPYTPLIHIQAEALEAKGELAQAIETALGASPNDAAYYPALVVAGRAARTLGRLAEADRHLGHAIASNSLRPDAYLERAWLRRTEGRIDEGMEDAKRADEALTSHPNLEIKAPLCAITGLLLADLQRFDEAEAMFARLFTIAPDEPRSLTWRGWSWLAAHRLDQASADVRAALLQDPQFEPALELLRVLEARGGE